MTPPDWQAYTRDAGGQWHPVTHEVLVREARDPDWLAHWLEQVKQGGNP